MEGMENMVWWFKEVYYYVIFLRMISKNVFWLTVCLSFE